MVPSALFSDLIIDFISVTNSFLKLNSLVQLSISSASVCAAVLIPKAGPRRAIMLALRSFVRRGPKFASIRTGDKSALLSLLKLLENDQFLVCRGPRGIGKTHLISDALTRTLGVVYVKIPPGTVHTDILKEAHAAIANIKLGPTVLNPKLDARRVLWWYRVLFRRSPTVVISAAQRTAEHIQKGIRLADIPGAARELAAEGFRVIVDVSENSISDERTGRDINLHCTPLPFESYHKDPQFETLFKLLSALGIRDAHLRALDGKATSLLEIRIKISFLIGGSVDSFDISRLKNEPALPDQLRSIVLTLLQAQIKLTRKVWTHVPIPLCQVAIDAFKSNRSAMQGVRDGALPSLDSRTFEELSVCKAFRVLPNESLAPASSALLLLLRHGDSFRPATLDECIIEELEDETKPKLPAAPVPVPVHVEL